MGHAPGELERLALQARTLDPATRHLLIAAGIRPGMRVLDVGTGHGDVAMLLSELVGPGGQVVAVDNAPASVEAARARFEARGINSIDVRLADVYKMSFEAPFDAVVGRLVLMHCADPVAAVKGLAQHLRPGGMLVCQEPDMIWPSESPTTLFDRVEAWIKAAMERARVDLRLGTRLPALFQAAGLPEPRVVSYATFAGASREDVYLQKAFALQGTMPLIARLGLATPEEIGIETLIERLTAEGREYLPEYTPLMIGAFTRKP